MVWDPLQVKWRDSLKAAVTHHPVSLDHVRYLVSASGVAPPSPTPALELVGVRDIAARALLQAVQHYSTAASLIVDKKKIK